MPSGANARAAATMSARLPSMASSAPSDGSPLRVRYVEVAVLPDVALVPEFAHAAAEILSESRM